jgi:hypothetical protein
MFNLRKSLLTAVAIFATTVGAFAADAPSKPVAPNITSGNPDLQKLIQQFNTRRDAIIADREALLNQLKSATEEQRKALLEKMQSQQKDLVDAQRALAKQIRDEMRKLRQAAPGGPGRR